MLDAQNILTPQPTWINAGDYSVVVFENKSLTASRLGFGEFSHIPAQQRITSELSQSGYLTEHSSRNLSKSTTYLLGSIDFWFASIHIWPNVQEP